jgi:hypothetical protein
LESEENGFLDIEVKLMLFNRSHESSFHESSVYWS